MADRFKKVYTQGSVNVSEIWVDTETGINYLYHMAGNSGGLTPCSTMTVSLLSHTKTAWA